MFILTPTLEVRPSSFRSGTNGILHPTALQWSGRQRGAMPLRWSLPDPVASVAINMALQKELFASSQLPRRCYAKLTLLRIPLSLASRNNLRKRLHSATRLCRRMTTISPA